MKKRISTVYIDSFSGAIGDMSARDQKDELNVLAVLSKNPKFSVFDATERPAISISLDSLKESGLIEYPQPQPGFPWCRVELTDSGKELL